MIPDAAPLPLPRWVVAARPLLLLAALIVAIVRPAGRAAACPKAAAGRAPDHRARDARRRRHPPLGHERRPRPGHHRAGHGGRRLLGVHGRARTTLAHLGRTPSTIPYPWVAGEAHLRQDPHVDRERRSSTRSRSRSKRRKPRRRTSGPFALIGLYVGVLPVALGLLLVSAAGAAGPTRARRAARASRSDCSRSCSSTPCRRGSKARRELAGCVPGRRRCFVGAAAAAYLGLETSRRLAARAARAQAPSARRTRRLGARAAHRHRHRPAQLRRRAGDRRGVRARRGRARHAADRRLHAAQHDRRARHPRADREGASVARRCSSGSG